jgi:digeranylgeranylglycerophospholipid reductase
VVISADGFPSTVAAVAGLADDRYRLTKNVAINYQYVMNGLDIESNVTEMFMGGSVAPGGYAWIIPKARSAANVGIGFRPEFAKSRRGKDYLDYFVGRHPIASQKLRNGAIRAMIADILPVDGATSRTYSENCLVAGDSAGMVMATNGGGIPTAMVAGHIAGEVAADHVLKHTPLSDYEARWKRALGEELRASARMRRFADAFMRHDRALDLAMLLLGTGGIKKVVTCKIPSGLDILMNLLGY